MTPTKEEIKRWLDENGYSYEWLAAKCLVKNGVAAVAVPLSEEDLKLISKAAQITGQTIEEFIRSAALEDAGE